MLGPKRLARYYQLRFLRLKGDPRYLARGVALGTFIGITPTIPLHTVLALLLSFIFRGGRIAALLATVAVSNPLTFFLQYYLSWRIGDLIHPGTLSWEKAKALMATLKSHESLTASLNAMLGLGLDAATVLVTGGVLLALPFAVAAYFASLRFFTLLRKKQERGRNPAGTRPGPET